MECAFEQFIEEIKEFLRETNQLSKDVEEHLRSYSGMQALKKVFKDASDGGRKDALELKAVCEEIVNSSYIETKNKAVVLSTVVKAVKPNMANIPGRLRPTAEEIEEYCARIQRNLSKADTLLQEMERKVGWNKRETKQAPLSSPFAAKQCYIWCKLIFELWGGSAHEMR